MDGRKLVRKCAQITFTVCAEYFFECKEKTQAMRASARLFDEAIGKIGKQDVQVINVQFLVTE